MFYVIKRNAVFKFSRENGNGANLGIYNVNTYTMSA